MLFYKIRKNLFIILAIGIFYATMPEKIAAQPGYTAVPFIESVLDIRMQSLGNSFVSFSGEEGAVEINPASIAQSRDLRFNFTKREWELFFDNDSFKLYQFGIQSGIGNWGFSYQGRLVDYAKGSFSSGEQVEYYQNLSTSFNNQKGLALGLGINYIRSDLGERISVSGTRDLVANIFSADLGFQYLKTFQSGNNLKFTPSVGTSITDFGTLVKYSEESQRDPLPMRFRAGVGLKVDHDKSWEGFQLFRGNLAFSVSKLLVSVGFDENNNRQAYGPFETLIRAWGNFDDIDPNTGRSTEYSLSEQLIFHTGLELIFLESFSFRLGYQNGQELNSFYSIRSIGFGIDLYYIAVDYVNSVQFDEDYNNSDTPINGEFLQLKGRIPLDGKSPKSLLRLFF